MSGAQQNFNAGQTQERAEQWMESSQNSANAALDKAHDAANATGRESGQNKEEAAGFLQQTGEQVKNIAQGAVDTVKQTLGMNKN